MIIQGEKQYEHTNKYANIPECRWSEDQASRGGCDPHTGRRCYIHPRTSF